MAMTFSSYLLNRKTQLLFGFLVVANALAIAQVEPVFATTSAADEKPVVLVIPFEPKLYMSEIDRSLNAESGLGYQELRSLFRNGIELQATYVLKKKFEVITISDGTPTVNQEFGYVYSSIGYDYRPVPTEPKPELTGIDKVKANAAEMLRQKEAEKDASNSGSPQNGQLQRNRGPQVEKFMAVSVINPKLFTDLESKHKADFILFVTQIDMVIPRNTDVRQLESDDYQRNLKLHFSLFDATGKEVYAGASIIGFSSKMNNPDKIIKSPLKEAIEQIATHIPGYIDIAKPGETIQQTIESDKTINEDY